MSNDSLFSSAGGGSGSIWDYFNEYGGGSAVEKLIEKEDTKFIDVISQDGLIQEMKSSNSKVITYFCDENRIDILLKYFFVEEEYHEDDEEKFLYKFPHLVMEILLCELSEFNRIFMEKDHLFKHFFEYLLKFKQETVINKGLIYYYIRTYNHFVEKHYIHCLEYFFRYIEENEVDNESFLEKYFLNHFGVFQFERFFLGYLGLFIKENELGAMIVGSIGAEENRSAIASIFGTNALSKLGGGRRTLLRRGAFSEEKRKKAEKQKEQRSKFASWIRSCEILKLLLNRFNPDLKDVEGEVYKGDEVDYVRAVFQLLTIIVENNDKFPELFDYLVIDNFGSTITFLFTKDEEGNKLRVSKPVFIFGIKYLGSVLKHITTKYFVNLDQLDGLSAISPQREALEATKEKLGSCLKRMQEGGLKFILPFLRESCNSGESRLGESELACMDYVVMVMKSLDTSQVESNEQYPDFLKWCIQNYEKYPFHNFFHTKVMVLFEHFFLNVSDERWIGEHIIKRTGLLDFILSSIKRNEEAPTVMQIGYIGHCFKYCQEIRKMKESMTVKSVGEDISEEPFMIYLKEKNWETFEKEILVPKFENYSKHLGGVDPKKPFVPSGGSSDTSDTTTTSSDSDTDSDSSDDDEVVVKGGVSSSDSTSSSSDSSDFSSDSDSDDDEILVKKSLQPAEEGPDDGIETKEDKVDDEKEEDVVIVEKKEESEKKLEKPSQPIVKKKKVVKMVLSDDSDTDSSDSDLDDLDDEEDVK